MLQGKCANGTLVLICTAQIWKSNAKFVERYARKRITSDVLQSVKHLVLRVIGLLINTETMEDATDIMKLAYIAFMSEFTTRNVRDALDDLSIIVNEFRMNAKGSATEKQMDIDNEADCGVALVGKRTFDIENTNVLITWLGGTGSIALPPNEKFLPPNVPPQ